MKAALITGYPLNKKLRIFIDKYAD
jgi:hypothetical protein